MKARSFLSSPLSQLLYGSDRYSNVIMPIYISIVGILFHVVLYSYYRGILKIKIANIIEIVNIAILPLVAFVFSKNLNEFFLWSGGFQILFSITLLTYVYIHLDRFNYLLDDIVKTIKTLFLYGIQRLPSDVGLNLLLTLPVLLATHSFGVKIGGIVAFAITLLSIVGYVFSPFGVVLLPRISKLLKEKEIKKIKLLTLKLLIFTITLTLIIVGISSIFLESLLGFYLGSFDKELLEVSYLVLYSTVGYTIFLVLRGIVDALHVKGINSIHMVLSMIFFGLSIGGVLYFKNKSSYQEYIIIFDITMYILAFFTLLWIYKRFKYDL